MSQSSPLPSRRAQRPPRINIKNIYNNNGSVMGSMPPTAQPMPPFTAQTNTTYVGPGGQPYWPNYANPFAAGNFMQKGFEGFVDFTKSGMSFGEKFTYGLYDKISKWSKKWFTHMFLLFVMTLYSVGGALLFGAIEGRQSNLDAVETHALQKEFFRAMQALSSDHELRKYSTLEFNGKLVYTLREYQSAVETLLTSNKTLEEMEKEKQPWSFWNAMFYCGTIYTTIARSHSQPRKAERLSGTEVYDLLRTVKRSLSSPRHKDESSETDQLEIKRKMPAQRPLSYGDSSPNTSNLSRVEQNLRRFEEERKRFEAEKYFFEREKQEFRQRYKHLRDTDERKRFLQLYRKNSITESSSKGDEVPEPRQLAQSLRLNRREVPVVRRRGKFRGYEESSTQLSSSEADNIEEVPVRPARITPHVSRNNSLSPIRPQRRSKTPEQRADIVLKQEKAPQGEIHPNPTIVNVPTTTETAPTIIITKSQEEHVSKQEDVQTLPIRKENNENAPVEKTNGNHLTNDDGSIETKKDPAPNIRTSKKISTFVKNIFSHFRKRGKTAETKDNSDKDNKQSQLPNVRTLIREFFSEAWQEWKWIRQNRTKEVEAIRVLRNKCLSHLIILIMLCGFGGLLFRYTEGASENIYKCEVRKVKRDFIDNLWTVSHNMREDDWKSLARQKLRKFEEELHDLQELGVRRHPNMRSWNFVNCILYCWTVVTTIGYGHITPQTSLGRSLTIIYAIIGIPMFLILLADFGKLFTRCMKFLWSYVRRVYYTGTCRQIRRQQQVRDAMSGFNTVYDMAIRRPSQFFGRNDIENDIDQSSETGKSRSASHPDTPTSPYPETFEIDDEFNLPVSLASILLISYILIGAFVYTLWEDWTYFEAFYFVFISMSTIGFGDFVPNHPIFMMCSIIYLIFGLALTSMFINVVQEKLSDTFKQASSKIGATIGIGLASEMGEDAISTMKTPSDLASVHGPRLNKIDEDEIESGLQRVPLTSILRQPRSETPQTFTSIQDDNLSDSREQIPPLLPRRQVSVESKPEVERKKRKRFFR